MLVYLKYRQFILRHPVLFRILSEYFWNPHCLWPGLFQIWLLPGTERYISEKRESERAANERDSHIYLPRRKTPACPPGNHRRVPSFEGRGREEHTELSGSRMIHLDTSEGDTVYGQAERRCQMVEKLLKRAFK
jgi:hypothetical protein